MDGRQTRRASLWRLREIRIVVPARAISVLGDGMLAIVLLLYLQGSGAGVWSITALLAAEALPIALMMGVAGRIADTYDSRTILVAATTTQALACVVLAFVSSLPAILFLVAMIQVGAALTSPTWAALVPRIVGEDGIGRAVALQSGLTAVAAPAGAALGGILFSLADARSAILVDAVTFAALAGAAMLVRTRRGAPVERVAQPDGTAPRRSLLAGLAIIRRDAIIAPMTWTLVAVIVVIGGVNVVDVFLVREALHAPAVLYGLAEVAFAAGSVGGSIVAAQIETDRRRLYVALIGFVVVGAAVAGEGVAPNFAVYLCIAVVVGVANAASNAAYGALVIRRTADKDRGKVSAFINGFAQVGMIAALGLGGGFGAAFGPRATFIVGGLATVVVALITGLRVAGQRRRGHRDDQRDLGEGGSGVVEPRAMGELSP